MMLSHVLIIFHFFIIDYLSVDIIYICVTLIPSRCTLKVFSCYMISKGIQYVEVIKKAILIVLN